MPNDTIPHKLIHLFGAEISAETAEYIQDTLNTGERSKFEILDEIRRIEQGEAPIGH